MPELLRKVDVAESEYVASIMAVNGYTTEFQPELQAKLNQFQVNADHSVMSYILYCTGCWSFSVVLSTVGGDGACLCIGCIPTRIRRFFATMGSTL